MSSTWTHFRKRFSCFCGRRRDRIKALYWEGDGFVLLYKRLEQGVYKWPRTDAELEQKLNWLMEQLRLVRHRQFGSSSEHISEEGMEQLILMFN